MVESVYGLSREFVVAKKVTTPNDKWSFYIKCEKFQNTLYFCYGYLYHSSLHGLRFPAFFSCCIHPEYFMQFLSCQSWPQQLNCISYI